MNTRSSRLLLVTILAVAAHVAVAEEAKSSAKNQGDEAAIKKSIESYVSAFNRGDAKSLAAHWSEAGSYVSPAGERLTGRAAIQQAFENLFRSSKGRRVEVANPTIRFPAADVAIEEGTARVISPDGTVDESSYIAIHVRQKGEWLIESIRETALAAEPPAQAEALEQLSWMVGEWVDHGDGTTIETRVSWTKNKAFLNCSFKVDAPGMDTLEGNQIIGWDAAAQTLRSWVFDTDGAVMQGVWTRKDNRWIVKSAGVLADGTTVTATNVYTVLDANTYKWRSFGRQAGDVALPDISEVTVKRKESPKATDAGSTKPAPKSKINSSNTSSNKEKP